MVMALAGNKADLEDKRQVTAEVSVIFPFTPCTKRKLVITVKGSLFLHWHN